MKRRMLFKIGVTLIIFVGIILFFFVDVEHGEGSNYHTVPMKDGVVYLMDIKDSYSYRINGEEVKEGIGAVKKDAVQDINALFEKQNELLGFEKKQHQSNSKDSLTEAGSGSEKKQLYSQNNIPDPQSPERRKKNNLFHLWDQKPVVSRDFRDIKSIKTSVHLCVVICENRAAEALTMLKSAAIVSKDVWLVFHVVADNDRQPVIQTELDSWPSHLKHNLLYHMYNVAFPQGPETLTAWNKLYKPCASQRLFLPGRLTSVDSLIYVDADTIFLQSVGDLWSFFKDFNSTQLVGLVQESEDGTAGWYNRFASHPYYGKFGINSGVMLMNMTRIRETTDWLSVLQQDYDKYRLALTWGDQDLINIYLANRPEQAYVVPCNWNYRTDHCMYTSNCRVAEIEGVALMHGSRGAFYSEKEPIFGALYQSFHDVNGPDYVNSLMLDVQRRIKNTSSQASSCNEVSSLFLKQLVRLMSSHRQSGKATRQQ